MVNRVNLGLGGNFTGDNAGLTDPNGHGTHVAGIIGAQGNNNQGISGVCWDVRLVPLRVFTADGLGNSGRVINAINHARNNNIPILNYSGGKYSDDPGLQAAINNYAGLFICSAGNGFDHDGDPNTPKIPVNTDITAHFPSSFTCANIISVANTTNNDTLDATSNFGANSVDLAAPGSNILSTYPEAMCDNGTHVTGHIAKGYHTLSGTSMAAPHVTGVVALVMSLRPDLTPLEVKSIVLNNTDYVSALNGLCVTGGRLNAYKAVLAARDYVSKRKMLIGDVNGDGKADYIMPWRRGNGKLSLVVFRGNATATGRFSEGLNALSSEHYYTGDENTRGADGYIADVNGDGCADYIMPWKRAGGYLSIVIFTGKTNGYFNEGINFHSQHYYTGNIDTRGPDGCMAEVNGDGRADYIMPWKRAGGYLSLVTFRGKPDSSSGYFVNDGENFHSQHYYVGPN